MLTMIRGKEWGWVTVRAIETELGHEPDKLQAKGKSLLLINPDQTQFTVLENLSQATKDASGRGSSAQGKQRIKAPPVFCIPMKLTSEKVLLPPPTSPAPNNPERPPRSSVTSLAGTTPHFLVWRDIGPSVWRGARLPMDTLALAPADPLGPPVPLIRDRH